MSHDDILKILIDISQCLAYVLGSMIGYRVGRLTNSKRGKK